MALRTIKGHPAFEGPLKDLEGYFKRGHAQLLFQTHVSFICGANPKDPAEQQTKLRHRFFEYVERALPEDFVAVKAETIVEEFSREPDENQINLGDFERLIAEIADSVLVFPESPGSFAELGFFAAHKEIATKTLIGNVAEFQDGSFITLGPVHYIASVSKYRPLPMIVGTDSDKSFQHIVERLLGGSGPRVRKRSKQFSFDQLTSLEARTQLAVLSELVSVCGVLTEPDLKHVLQTVFGRYDISRIRQHLAILVAMGLVRRSESSHVVNCSEAVHFIRFDSEERVRTKARWSNAYRISAPDVLEEAGVDGQG